MQPPPPNLTHRHDLSVSLGADRRDWPRRQPGPIGSANSAGADATRGRMGNAISPRVAGRLRDSEDDEVTVEDSSSVHSTMMPGTAKASGKRNTARIGT